MFSVPGVLQRSGGRALAIAFLVAAVLVTGVAASNQKSFNGTVNETFTTATCPSPAPNLMCAASSGSGKISDVGKVTSSFLGILDLAQMNPPGSPCFLENSSGTLTAKKGDQIFVTDNNGSYCPTGLTTATVTGSFTITGGTGSFTGATGGGNYTATVTGASSTEVYTGTISVAKCDSNNSHSNNDSNGNGNGNGNGDCGHSNGGSGGD